MYEIELKGSMIRQRNVYLYLLSLSVERRFFASNTESQIEQVVIRLNDT